MKIIFYDTKPYDKEWFEEKNNGRYEIEYLETKLNRKTAKLAEGYEGVVAFVNDSIDEKVIDVLYNLGVKIIAMRCAGFNNVDMKAAYGKVHVVRVPAYSPYSVAEHAMALLLCINRKIHKSYNRTRENNFTLAGLTGFDLHGKTIGVVGTGKIGAVFIEICKGFGMKVLAYDMYPNKSLEVDYVSKEELFAQSDIISLHCPLTEQTFHLIDSNALELMKDGVVLINTSRGQLIKKEDLLAGLKSKKIKAAGLDVYEEEAEYFFEDYSNEIIDDDILSLLVSMPNVILTSHQAFLTKEALESIAETTFKNLDDYQSGARLENEICYYATSEKKHNPCTKKVSGRCF
ncbi:MAG: 2-hydroxyacid dehydrogenase [Velocimicrobium sp.]